MGTKNNPGQFDCYDKAEPDEPIFVLIGRDQDAPELVELWAKRRSERLQVTSHTDLKVREALECAEQMRRWRANG